MHSETRRPFAFPALSALLSTALATAGLFAACGPSRDEKAGGGTPIARVATGGPGTESVRGLEALGDTIASRARRGDTLGLVRLMVGDSAYRRNVYPLSPAYNPDSKNAFEFVLGMNNANSAKGLRRLLFDLQGAPGAPVVRPPLDTFDVAEGRVFLLRRETAETRSEGLVPWSSALCRASGCQVISYARAGVSGPRDEDGE